MKKEYQEKNIISQLSRCSLAGLILLSGCTVFQPAKTTSTSTYSIEAKLDVVGTETGTGQQTILVSIPSARSGYDSRRMVYTKRPHELEFFTQNQWVDSPARMLTPLLMQSLENSGKFRAVVSSRSVATVDLQLETDIIRLHHDFTTRPSLIHLTVRTQLTDIQGKRVLASREFNITEAASSEDPYGGVLATNRAVKTLLQQIAEFCAAESKVGK